MKIIASTRSHKYVTMDWDGSLRERLWFAMTCFFLVTFNSLLYEGSPVEEINEGRDKDRDQQKREKKKKTKKSKVIHNS